MPGPKIVKPFQESLQTADWALAGRWVLWSWGQWDMGLGVADQPRHSEIPSKPTAWRLPIKQHRSTMVLAQVRRILTWHPGPQVLAVVSRVLKTGLETHSWLPRRSRFQPWGDSESRCAVPAAWPQPCPPACHMLVTWHVCVLQDPGTLCLPFFLSPILK